MKIFINANIMEAFWNHFAPKDVISLVSTPSMGGVLCIVDVKNWGETKYTEQEVKAIYEEIKQWVPVIR